MAAVTWLDIDRRQWLRCRVCGGVGEASVLGTVTALSVTDLPVVRCPSCGSIGLADTAADSSPTDESVDAYIEGGAGIGTIAATLTAVDPGSVRRFLDVGCNFGFALDLGRFQHGWQVVGVEPSLAGRRGAAELDLDIRPIYLDADTTDLGDPFDLVLASEVVEHVTDPVAFLSGLRSQLAPEGTVLLTTPAAEIIDPRSADADVISAISPGYHVFLASARGLELLLRQAGFRSVLVWRRHGALYAAAAAEADRQLRPPIETAGVEATLLPYYLARTASAAPGSALAAGMSARALRAAVAHGDFVTAAGVREAAIDAVARRHQLRLDDPAGAARQVLAGRPVGANVAGVAFALGMTALLADGDHDSAAEYFGLCGVAIDRWEKQIGVLDLDSVDLRFQAAGHRALAAAADRPDEAVSGALGLARFRGPSGGVRVAARQCRIFVDLVARAHYPQAHALAAVADAQCGELMLSTVPADRHTALDVRYSLGILALIDQDGQTARGYFGRCRRDAERIAERWGPDPQLDRISAWAADQIEVAVRLGAIDEPDLEAELIEPGDYGLDVYWCDARGIYLQGWAHAGSLPIDRITVRVGELSMTAPPLPTPQLLEYWPNRPAVAVAGFSTLLTGRPTGEVTLVVHTAAGDREYAVRLPDHPLPELATVEDQPDLSDLLADLIAQAPPGPVLALGVRAVDEMVAADRRRTFGDREVFGVDIHPGPGVDIVADVHDLSDVVVPGSFAVVYSASLLEHLAAPWIAARECAAALMIGGLAVHVAPWTWPTHGEPNDFWRFSPEALEQLFGPATGFATVERGSIGAMRVLLDFNRSAAPHLPTTTSAAFSWIAAAKTAVTNGELRWPYDLVAGRLRAQLYPVDGLNPAMEFSP